MFHFYFYTSNTTDWLTFTMSVLTFIVSCITLYIGYTALGEWRKQKRHDIMVDALSLARRAKEYINILRIPLNSFDEIHEDYSAHFNEIKKNYPNLSKPYYTTTIVHSRRRNNRDLLTEISNIYEKLLVELKEEHPLTVFFKKVLDIDKKVFDSAIDYFIIKRELIESTNNPDATNVESNAHWEVINRLPNDGIENELNDLYLNVETFRKEL